MLLLLLLLWQHVVMMCQVTGRTWRVSGHMYLVRGIVSLAQQTTSSSSLYIKLNRVSRTRHSVTAAAAVLSCHARFALPRRARLVPLPVVLTIASERSSSGPPDDVDAESVWGHSTAAAVRCCGRLCAYIAASSRFKFPFSIVLGFRSSGEQRMSTCITTSAIITTPVITNNWNLWWYPD